MTREQYVAITDFIRKSSKREKIFINICKYSPIFIALVYAITVLQLILTKNPQIYLFILVPAVDLIFVSVFRKILNKPRPYDKLNYKPIGKFKRGKGQSFPSRHTASSFIVAMSCLYLNETYGIIMLISALFLGISRIISGLHYPKDVFAGGLISILFGYIGFFF